MATFSSARGSAFSTLFVATLLVGLALNSPATAQDLTPEEQKMLEQVPAEHRSKALAELQRRKSGGAPSSAKPPQGEPKKEEGEKKPEENKEKKEDGAKTIKRPTDSKSKADADELKAAAVDGKVQFNFRGQPWTDVLEWFAGVAGYSLDWQELPADLLNLSTQRPYTIAETRDLLNQTLLPRGFTMILHDDVLSVVKIDKLDPSLVPRVEPDDLDEHSPHDFARTRFPLPDTMDPAKAVEDVKAMLTPTAKVTPLLASKQLQVIDAVANLRDVRDLLYGEQLEASKDVRPKPFLIRHRRADYVADQVMIVLGLDPSSRKSPMELQLEQQRMQLMMQMQGKGTDVSKMLKQDGPPVFIAVDKQRNAILVNAPPAEMALVERTVAEFDVPESEMAAARGEGRELTLEKYPTNSTDAVVTALKELGTLDPLTQLQSDSRADVIFAYATPEDHLTIARMIDKLDGEGRSGYVIALNRQMPADQAAGTIQALMVGEPKEEEDNSRSRYFGYFGYGGGDSDRGRSDDGEFRIQADVENNRLLLWANEPEYKEVYTLLETLGAVTTGRNNLDKMRVWEAGTPEETAKLLERLQQSWNGENKLEISAPPAAKKQAEEKPAVEAKPAEEEKRDKLTGEPPLPTLSPQRRMWLAQFSEGAAETTPGGEPASAPADAGEQKTDGPAAVPPPVKINVSEDGRIVLSSDDVDALDQLEELMADLTPAPKEYEVFFLKNAAAFDVWYNLEDYFDEELKAQSEPVYDYWGDYRGSRRAKSGPSSLGKRRQLRFIYDDPTNTVVVQNASEAQLEVIRELITIYDRPIGEDSVAKRRTEAIQIRYSQAQQIATALKEVYRDLLSSKDKEFQSREGQEQRSSSGRETYFRFYGGGGGDGDDKKSSPVKVAFEGALSIGVDEISNTLIISAEENVFENVREIIRLLDEQAKPSSVVQVHELRGTIAGKDLKAALTAALSQPWAGGKPPATAAAQQNGGGDNDGDRSDRRSDRDRGDRRGRDGDNDNNSD